MSVVCDNMTYRMTRSRLLNEAIRAFADAADEQGKEDLKKMQAVLAANLDQMRDLVEATGKVAAAMKPVAPDSETIDRHLATILEMHPDGKKEFP